MEFMKTMETILVVVVFWSLGLTLTFVFLHAMSGIDRTRTSNVPKSETEQDEEERDYFSSYAHYTDNLPVKIDKNMKDVVWSEDYQSRVRND